MKNKILVSAFKPFLGSLTNPSELILHELNIVGIDKQLLPVDFDRAFLELKKRIDLNNPEIVIMLGQGSSRDEIHLEKVALNWNESEYPDESENHISMGPIDDLDPELAIMTSFPVNSLYQKMKTHTEHIKISFSAGTYVCNNLYYKVLSSYPMIKSIFIHVPNEDKINIIEQIKIIRQILKIVQNDLIGFSERIED